jgi:hypothetical protein
MDALDYFLHPADPVPPAHLVNAHSGPAIDLARRGD